MLEIVDARIEVEGVRVEPLAPSPEGYCPQTDILNRLAQLAFERATEGPRFKIEGIDGPVADVADEQRLAEPAELGRGKNQAPGSVQWATRNERRIKCPLVSNTSTNPSPTCEGEVGGSA